MSVDYDYKEQPRDALPIERVVVTSDALTRKLIACEHPDPRPEVLVQVRACGGTYGLGITPADARSFAAALVRLANQVDAR